MYLALPFSADLFSLNFSIVIFLQGDVGQTIPAFLAGVKSTWACMYLPTMFDHNFCLGFATYTILQEMIFTLNKAPFPQWSFKQARITEACNV
jgi:hypothetical protein